MEIHLVQPPIGGTPQDVSPPLGVMALAATLEADQHKVHIADLNLAWKQGKIDPRKSLRTQLLQALPKRSSQIDLVGVTTWSYNFEVTMEFVEAAKKKHPHAPIVLGGPHATFVDREILQAFKCVDFVLRDEGDHTFPRLARAIKNEGKTLELSTIPGLTWRQGSEVVRNPSGPVVEDLDALPRPAYHLIDAREYMAMLPVLIVEAGRGCPYNCNFCSTTNMFQRRYRVKSPARLVDEIEWLSGKMSHARFELLHDNLVASGAYIRELCAEIRKRCLDINWSCTSRTDNMDEELCEAMFLAGCVSIFYGIETMDEKRQQWTGKKLKPPLVEAAVALTGRQHVRASCGIIVGFPDETDDELDATVGAALRWTTDPKIHAEISTAALRFYPGADLFGHAQLLRYDAIAAKDNAVVPGLELRPEWRTLTRLFALSCIHTPPEETRRNICVRNFTRTLLKACPQTFRGVVEVLGIKPSVLFKKMMARELRFLDSPSHDLVWNETVQALASVIQESGSPLLLELLSSEVPFWKTTPIVGPLDRLEHVVHPKRYQHDELLAYVQRRRETPPAEIEGEHILSIRGGRECVVWFTKDPKSTLQVFERSYAQDRAGTLKFLEGLKRGL